MQNERVKGNKKHQNVIKNKLFPLFYERMREKEKKLQQQKQLH